MPADNTCVIWILQDVRSGADQFLVITYWIQIPSSEYKRRTLACWWQVFFSVPSLQCSDFCKSGLWACLLPLFFSREPALVERLDWGIPRGPYGSVSVLLKKPSCALRPSGSSSWEFGPMYAVTSFLRRSLFEKESNLSAGWLNSYSST